jgi:hypothetical protein
MQYASVHRRRDHITFEVPAMMLQLLEANGIASDSSATRFILDWDLPDASPQGMERVRGILRHNELVEVDVYSLLHIAMGVLRGKKPKNTPKPSDSDDKLCSVRSLEHLLGQWAMARA